MKRLDGIAGVSVEGTGTLSGPARAAGATALEMVAATMGGRTGDGMGLSGLSRPGLLRRVEERSWVSVCVSEAGDGG